MYSTRDKCLLYIAHHFKYEKVTKFVKLFSDTDVELFVVCRSSVILTLPYEGFSSKTLCALNLISMFLL